MARKGTFRAVVAVLLGLLAALCLLSLAAAQPPTIVETECTNLQPKACKKSGDCISTYDGKKKKKNHRCTKVGRPGEENCFAVQKAKGKPNMRERCNAQEVGILGGSCQCSKPKKKCGVCVYKYVAPDIPPVGPTPNSPPPPVVTPPPPPKVNPVPGTATDGPEEARARGPPRLRARRAPRPFPVRS